ncbi:hypothetical protein [Lewinella sp. LCG006]|uniref:hypothetical protein n=1 Tax=Lewinella sp. LCG006 TaxID=3231911 RepID=UPI003460EC86
MYELYSLIKHEKVLEIGTRGSIIFLLSTVKNKFAYEIFTDQKLLKEDIIRSRARFYFAKMDFEYSKAGLIYLLESADDRGQEFSSILANLNLFLNNILVFLNDEEIVNLFDAWPKKLTKLPELSFILNSVGIDRSRIQNTYFYRLYKDQLDKI